MLSRADAAALTAASAAALGEPVTLRAADGAEAEAAALVERGEAFAGASLRGTAPRLTARCAAADLPAGFAAGAGLERAGGDAHRVEHVEADGLGGVRLTLSEA